MCGIAGLVRFAGLRAHERNLGAQAAACLRHRGPDDTGAFADHYASLGHARLSIIDLQTGRQPISNENGTIHVVFNGEIYNYRTLADQLRARGHRLRTRCDTEVLVHLYEDYGDAFVEHLNGMFAIALWDSPRRTLLLVRDRMGIKPLYWHDDGRRIVFGSELKAVLAAGDVPRQIDPCAMTDYLTFGHVPAPRTIFDGVRKLEPGFLARCTASGVSLRRYWDIPFKDDQPLDRSGAAAHMPQGCQVGPTGGPGPGPDSELRRWTEQLAELLQDAVAMRLVADVPLGAFLSGGVDSAAVVAAMTRKTPGTVMTHTVGFDEAKYDERAAARTVARRLRTDHREMIVQPDAAWAAMNLVIRFDEPFADPCAVPMFYLSRAARQRVTVALSGDGGDEMLAGYRRYRFDLAEGALRGHWPAWLRRPVAGLAGWVYPKGDWLPRTLRAKVTLQNLARDDATAHLRSVALHAGTLPGLLLRPEFAALQAHYDPFARGRELFARCRSPHLLNRVLYLDMKTSLADGILTKVDRMSMAVGLEVRVPLLDHRLVELSARMPVWLKRCRTRDKWVLREITSQWVGADVAGRKKKGFDLPLDDWFRGPLREVAHDLLSSRNCLCGQWVDGGLVGRLMSLHRRGLRANGHLLWTLLVLELWARAYARPAAAGTAPRLGQLPALRRTVA